MSGVYVPVGDTNDVLGGITVWERGEGDTEMEYCVRGYCSNHNNLATKPSSPLDYAMGLEYHHLTMSILWGPEGHL